VHDSRLLGEALDARVVRPGDGVEQNVCLDAGFTGKEKDVEARGCIPHIRPRGEEAREIMRNPDFKARRWIVECFHSWLNRFRKLIPRYEKTDLSYQALVKLACAMIVFNKIIVIYG
jgi:transposase